jgi:aminoglycoside phosphotransferase (APT) family kinase protein
MMDALLETVLEELRPRLPEWYPDLDGNARLDVLEMDSRVFADVIRIDVLHAEAPPTTLVVKAPSGDAPADTTDRPRLVPMTDPADRLELEFEALRTLEARLAATPDPSLTAVRPLGILPRSAALVMEAFEGQPLHRLLVRGSFRRAAELRPATLARRAGRWLRVLHDTPTENRPVRQGARADLVEAFTALGSYLAEQGAATDLDAVIAAGIRATSELPDPLPTVVSHGDFAPRNILVDNEGRVAVIDLLARWQSPPFEDLAGFLVALQTSRANAATRGLLFGRAVARLEPAFLAGYYGSDPVPRTAIRVYELLLLLDKWSARASRGVARGGVSGLRERMIDSHFDARSRFLARRLLGGS